MGPRGYTIHHAATGLDGLQLARRIHPDIILLDMNLPDLDGKVISGPPPQPLTRLALKVEGNSLVIG